MHWKHTAGGVLVRRPPAPRRPLRTAPHPSRERPAANARPTSLCSQRRAVTSARRPGESLSPLAARHAGGCVCTLTPPLPRTRAGCQCRYGGRLRWWRTPATTAAAACGPHPLRMRGARAPAQTRLLPRPGSSDQGRTRAAWRHATVRGDPTAFRQQFPAHPPPNLLLAESSAHSPEPGAPQPCCPRYSEPACGRPGAEWAHGRVHVATERAPGPGRLAVPPSRRSGPPRKGARPRPQAPHEGLSLPVHEGCRGLTSRQPPTQPQERWGGKRFRNQRALSPGDL